MSYRKTIGQFLILLMLAAQVILAQHATVHFSESQYTQAGQAHDDGHSDKDSKNKLCDVCIIAKHLHDGLSAAGFIFTLLLFAFALIAWPRIDSRAQCVSASYAARAPPILLS